MIGSFHTVRVGIRSLRRTPGFTLAAIGTLALGIGLSITVFTVADALLIRPLPVRDQDRLVTLWGARRDGSFDNFPLELRDAREFVRGARSLERIAFTTYEGAWPTPVVGPDGDGMSRLRRALVSGEFFAVLGAQPVLGRTLRAEDDVAGAPVVVVLTHAAWQRMFAGDPSIVGRQIVLHENGAAVTIVGVMPQGLEYPRGVELWAPLVPTRTIPGTDSIFAHVNLLGRLAPGATPDMARDEMSAWFERPDAPAWAKDVRGVAHPLPRLILGETKPAIIAFVAASGLLLLITCINVANLLLVRGLGRVREMAVRSALGAGRGRIIGQLLVENALLAIAGGAAGLAVAAAGIQSFIAFAPPGTPRIDEIQLNASAGAGAIAITALAMLAFAVAPAVLTSRVELQSVLGSGARTSASGRSRLMTEGLVAGQIALALLILSAAGLIARSLIELQRAELAFEPSHLLIGELGLRHDQFADAATQRALLERLVPRIEAIPGVRSVSPVVAVPFSGSGGWDGKPSREGQSPAEAAGNPMVNMEVVEPTYFMTLGLPVLRGRAFTDADRAGTAVVVMLSESAARHYWPNDDPVGKRLMMGSQPLTVIGIVPDTRYRDLRVARPSIYFSLRQSFFPFAPLNLAIRTTTSPADLVPAIRRTVSETAAGVALVSAAPFPTFLEGPLAQPRLNALLLGVFAGAAVVLAAVGLFAVMMTMVRQRTRELGVRMALGATARDLREMVMRRGLAIAAVGAAVGLLGALLANRLLASMLYEVAPTDAATLGGVTALLLGIAALASFLPARSGGRIDPMEALRADT